ncbi:casein kinase 1-like protein 2 [Pyrus communis]|uniref:casein kinase 1-like protein 2 n=1 Tax=Pyrus communis TaxID=23211 RepID=UPI0035C14D9F
MESVVGGNGWFDRKSRPVVNGRFRVGPIIRFSQFGVVYHGTDTFTKQLVEIKLFSSNPYELFVGGLLYWTLAAGISKVGWIGVEGDHNALVMDINRVEFVHSKSFLHQDIKPENFLFGAIKQPNEVGGLFYSFGVVFIVQRLIVSCFKVALRKCRHFGDGKKWKHNVAYSSINAHRGVEQSCRDDLESLGYVLTYFLRGSLPWQEVSARTREEEFEKMCEIKESISIEELCRGYPREFAAYLNYCRSLRFDEKPDHAYLRKLFRRLFDRKGYRRDLKYDWVRNPACLLSEEGIVVARRLYRKVVPYCPRNKNAGPVIKHCN